MSLKEVFNTIDGVRYTVEGINGANDFRIVFQHRAPVDVLEKIYKLRPVGLEPVEFIGTQEHYPAVELRWMDEIRQLREDETDE